MTEDEVIKVENEKLRQVKVSAYKRFAMTDDGKIILEDLDVFCGFHRMVFSEQSPNPISAAINDGKRRVYLRFDGFINQELEKENG